MFCYVIYGEAIDDDNMDRCLIYSVTSNSKKANKEIEKAYSEYKNYEFYTQKEQILK